MTDQKNQKKPLEGIRIVEYAVFHAGPGANAILGDLGADVIKIEAGDGDPMRLWKSTGALNFSFKDGGSIMFEASNRNKRAIKLDIKTEKGREILHRLVKDADVFLTNLRKSTKIKYGIDYESLSKINPQLIHANVSGYGPEGKLSDHGAFDALGQARSGMTYITGTEEPTLIQLAVLDQSTAIAASHAILTALVARNLHGVGQEIHVSLYSTALWLMYANLLITGNLHIPANTSWNRKKNSPLRNSFLCKDGKWILGTNHPEERYWPMLCRLSGREDLINNPKFVDSESRHTNNAELIEIFDEIFLAKTRDEWMDLFLENGLMFCSVQELEEVFTDPQALENKYIVDLEHPVYGTMKVPGYPVHFSAYDAGTHRFAPNLGEHTDMVMQEIGYSEQEIRDMKKDGVIA